MLPMTQDTALPVAYDVVLRVTADIVLPGAEQADWCRGRPVTVFGGGVAPTVLYYVFAVPCPVLT